MIYIINTIIAFDPVTRNLSLKNDAQLSVELSKPATRLLSELIEHNHATLLREDLIKSVWEDYGFSPSKGNLSNSISELRKAFTSLGLHQEIIITVPRTGFKLEAEIHPLVKYEKKLPKPWQIPWSRCPSLPVYPRKHACYRDQKNWEIETKN